MDLELSESWNSRQMRWTALLPLIVLIRHRGGLNGGKAALGARFTVNRADGTEEHCLRKQGCVFIRKIDSIFRQVAAEVGVIRLREIKKH